MFEHLRKLGLCLGAAMLLGALVATGASAAEPEYRACIKTEKTEKVYTAKYLDKLCTEKASPEQIAEGKHNKYESVLAPEEVPFTGKDKAMTLTAAGKVVICKKGTSAGELTTERFGIATFTFTKCGVNGSSKAPCNSPAAAAGTIETNTLHTGLVHLDEEESVLGVIFTAFGPIMEVECGAEAITVRGRVLGTVENNKKGIALTFAASGGKQEVQSFWLEEEEFGPFTLYTENEAEEEVEATMSLTTQEGPKGIFAA